MAMLVVALHTFPDTNPSLINLNGKSLGIIALDAVCRCAVPFFFITSGYYFRVERGVWTNVRRVVVRLTPIYLFWSICYLPPASFFDRVPDHWRLLELFQGGGYAYHLWFLPALAFGIVTLTVTLAVGGLRFAVLTAAALALIGPLLFDYHPVFGVDQYSSHLADFGRQLAAPAYVIIGYLLKRAPAVSTRTCIALCLATLIGILVERYCLAVIIGNAAVKSGDGLIMTFCFGAAVFLLARSLDDAVWVRRFAWLGAISLAVYICHIFFMWIYQYYLPVMPGRRLVCFVLTAGSATLAAIGLVRIPLLRRLTT